jgi:hypothetical protein
VGHTKGQAKNPQRKNWNLVCTYGRLNDAGRYEVTGRETIGTFQGHEDAWDALAILELEKYGTSEDELIKVVPSFYKGNRAAANIGKLSNKRGAKGARRYTLEPVE